MPTRRDALRTLALAAPLLWLPRHVRPTRAVRERRADIVVIGGGLGGCAAALAALAHGRRVILTEATDWIGGQLTAQGVPPDENRWIESIGANASYLALREQVRAWYRAHTPLTARARANARLNPGNGWVSRLCAEPRVWLTALEALLAPHVASGRLVVLRRHVPVRAEMDGDRVRAVTVRARDGGDEVVLAAPTFLDATELGELLPLTGTEHVTGAESRAESGEPGAPEVAQPDNQQGFTVCFAMEHRAGESHVIDRPDDYATWRDLVPDAGGARLLSFDDPGSARIGFDPVARTGFWSYRRVVDRDQFTPGAVASDVTIVNWGQNDYSFGPLAGVDAATAAGHEARARSLSRSLLYWLQTEAPRPDGGAGWPGLRLRPDILGTADGLAMAPYIRESRRIRAEVTVREQDVTVEGRMAATGLPRERLTARPHADAVGIGHYALDLHRSVRGDRGAYAETLPFTIPLGALLPVRVDNLLPACKNLGVTHRANGCHRLHPIEWGVGEAAGHLAAVAQARRVPPRAVRARGALLAAYQHVLTAAGVRIAWPDPLPPG